MFLRTLTFLGALGAIAVGCGGGSTTPETNVGSGANAATTGTPSGSGGTSGAGLGSTGSAGTTGTNGGTSGSNVSSGNVGTTSGTVGTSGSSGGTGGANSGSMVASGGTSGTGMSGAGGSSDEGGLTGDGGRPSGPSAGCNQAPPNAEPIGKAYLHMIDITGMAQEYVAGYTHRVFCTTIPENYDQTKAYPVVFYGPGCGATACEGSSFTGRTDIFYVQAISSADATMTAKTIVPANGSPGCFQTGVESTVDSPELNYFDQVMAQVQTNYCVDKGRTFAAGTSSGGWLSNYLGCARGNVIRGIAADSGGMPYAHPTCTGGAAAMEFPGDSATKTDAEGHEIGVSVARDLFIQLNGCNTTPTNMMFGTASCQYYGGCSSPVVWCDTGGAHQAGNSYLSPSGSAFWNTLN
jgi:polyhydroxybutyrate depolymerase